MSHCRNNTLDVIKLFAAYMVVFIHVLFYGNTGIIFDALARFAVPFFFLVSGFYSHGTTLAQIQKRIVHLLSLLAVAVIIYTTYNVLLLSAKHDFGGIALYFSQYLDLKALVKLLVFNIPIHTTHLWYLLAILYVYLIFYVVTACKIHDCLVFSISILFLLLHIFLGEFLSFFSIFVPEPVVRNFALMGLPFFGLGILAKKHEKNLLNVPNFLIILSAIIGVTATLLSRYLISKNELYIGSLFILFSLIVTYIKFSNIKFPPMLIKLTRCSTYIYILHPLISYGMRELYACFNISIYSSVTLQMVHPLIVCFLSTISAHFIGKITHLLKIK